MLRRVVVGLVLGGLAIGTAIVAVDLLQTGIPILAIGLFAVVAVASLIVIWRIARPPVIED